MYKHVAKQRRLVNSNKELHLSDEDSSGNSSSSDGGRSDSGSDSDSDDSGEGEDDDDILGGLGGKEEDAGEEEEEDSDDEEILPPPAGFPTALEATINPIGEPEDDDEEDGTLKEEGVPVCAVCPNKALKKGKMLELHLKSKDHVRRFARFKVFVIAPEFPADLLGIDARTVAAQLDKQVNERLSLQTQFGGPSSKGEGTTMTGLVPLRQQSNRAALREIKHAKRDERRIARKAIRGVKKMESSNRHQVEMNAHKKRKRELLEQAKLEAEGKDPSTASSSPKKNQLVAADGVVKSKKRKSEDVKPTVEEIALRQEGKRVKREAAATALAEKEAAKATKIPLTATEKLAKRAAKKEAKKEKKIEAGKRNRAAVMAKKLKKAKKA